MSVRTDVGTVEDLHASATKAVGLDDFGTDDDNYREALGMLLESYQHDADLTEFGSKMCRFFVRNALVARLMSEDIHKVTIVPRGRALGFMMSLPEEDRYVLSKEELEDWLKVTLAGRAAEQIVFGRITNGAANDLDRATSIARSMVFDWGMGRTTHSQQVRADNYAWSEETKRLRDAEQARLTDEAYDEAMRLLTKYRLPLDRVAIALLERETLVRDQLDELLGDVTRESRSSETIGTVQVLPASD